VGPNPTPPPPQRQSACEYCHFSLVCGFTPPETEEAEA